MRKVPRKKTTRTIQEINRKIRQGGVVVVTADEMTEIVKKQGPKKAAAEIDVVATGTFSPMCSSGAFINFGHTKPTIKASKVWLNDVPAYAGLAAVDIYIGATEPAEDDPLNRVHPGQFKYGGGHVIHDLVSGKRLSLRAEAYGTDCYPNRKVNKRVRLADLPYAALLNPRNGYQNYNCAVNLSNRTIYTYMGVLKPKVGNANYATSGQLSPLFNDPYYLTVGLGTRIFLGGAHGYVVGPGTQHNPRARRGKNGVPLSPAGTLMVMGDLKQMDPERHRKITGVKIDLILENAGRLGKEGPPVWVRTPIIPGYTDGRENIRAVAEFIKQEMPNVERYDLLAFNNLCIGQYDRLGTPFALKETPLIRKEVLADLKEVAEKAGVTNVHTSGATRLEEVASN